MLTCHLSHHQLQLDLRGMDLTGWKPWDLIVGGMLTAGLAFGVYKFGRLGRKAAGGALVVTELDATNLQECIALAGRPSELEVAVLPQPDPRCRQLAASLRQAIQEARSSSSHHRAQRDGRRNDAAPRADPRTLADIFKHLCAETKREFCDLLDSEKLSVSPIDTLPQHHHFCSDPYYSPLMVERAPPELTRQLQSYRDILKKWTADSEAKIEKMEQQRMSLATELHVTREALQTERRHRAEAEQRRQQAELQLQELEVRLHKCLETKGQRSQREEEVQRLEQQVQDMEEQLEMLYLHNVVTPRHAMQNNMQQQQQLSQSLQQAQSELETQQCDLQEMENEIANLTSQLSKMRTNIRQLSEENTLLQKQMHAAQQAACELVTLLLERSAVKDSNKSELMDLLNVPDTDLSLDKLLKCLTNHILHS